nr:unnamed protein product [Callosobruchus analis]
MLSTATLGSIVQKQFYMK